jgi:hypothetical protein
MLGAAEDDRGRHLREALIVAIAAFSLPLIQKRTQWTQYAGLTPVMPALCRASRFMEHSLCHGNRDGRDKPGHDASIIVQIIEEFYRMSRLDGE